jgi:hypothetical protein
MSIWKVESEIVKLTCNHVNNALRVQVKFDEGAWSIVDNYKFTLESWENYKPSKHQVKFYKMTRRNCELREIKK